MATPASSGPLIVGGLGGADVAALLGVRLLGAVLGADDGAGESLAARTNEAGWMATPASSGPLIDWGLAGADVGALLGVPLLGALLGADDGAVDVLGVGDVVGVVVVGVVPRLLWYTCRIDSCAVSPMLLSTPWVSLPGTDTTMFSPSTFTSALPTPRPFTRLRMMLTAVFRSLFLIDAPCTSSRGLSVTVVPPRRSSPSAGECVPLRNIPPNNKINKIATKMRARPGFDRLAGGT
jgi:hypothetical protein